MEGTLVDPLPFSIEELNLLKFVQSTQIHEVVALDSGEVENS